MLRPFTFIMLTLEKKTKHGHVEKCYTGIRKIVMTPTKNVKEQVLKAIWG